jgi:uncharacterized protein involved in outer membrane biogenesis
VLPRVAIDRPVIEARSFEDRRANYLLDLAGPPGEAEDDAGSASPRVGTLAIQGGEAHVAIDWLAADFNVAVSTQDVQDAGQQIVAEARGTYASQPIEARMTGGAVLNLRDKEQPWPVRLEVANGPTRATLNGTLRDPLALRGADLRLDAQGPDMALLSPLSGVPFPKTPPFQIGGRLDYAAGRVRFMDAQGRMGRTDLSGGLIVTVSGPKTVIAAEVRSRQVDLADLAGFFGGEPGRPTTPGMTPQQRAEVRQADAQPRLLSDKQINLPRLRAADIHVDYTAAKIEGRGMPLDALTTQFDIVDGVVDVKRIAFPIGDGEAAGHFTLTPQPDDSLRATGEAQLRRVDFSRLMGSAGVQGSGRLGGVGRFEGRGRSLAEIFASGQGGMTAVMVGGTLSAFLVDLSGLQFGKAVLSALGLPERERIECLVADFPMRRGVLSARTLLMETDGSLITGSGQLDLGRERIDLRIRTESKHFSIGSLPTPILIGGTLKKPSVGLEPAEAAARAGAAAGLGVIAPPLAILPTIQLGVGESTACERMQARARGGRGGSAEAGGSDGERRGPRR